MPCHTDDAIHRSDLCLTWSIIFTKSCEGLPHKVPQNPAVRNAAVFFRYLRKTSGRVAPTSPCPGEGCDLTSSCIFQSLRACQKDTKDTNSLKLAVCNMDVGRYLRVVYLGFFLYRWPQVMSFLWPTHYKSMVKNWSTSNAHQICPTHTESWSDRPCLISPARCCIISTLKGHLRSHNDVIGSPYVVCQ